MPDIFSTLYFGWHLPSREWASGDIPNLNDRAREDPLMTEDDYEPILKHGLHRFFSFRRAGVWDLGKLVQVTPQTKDRAEMGGGAQGWLWSRRRAHRQR